MITKERERSSMQGSGKKSHLYHKKLVPQRSSQTSQLSPARLDSQNAILQMFVAMASTINHWSPQVRGRVHHRQTQDMEQTTILCLHSPASRQLKIQPKFKKISPSWQTNKTRQDIPREGPEEFQIVNIWKLIDLRLKVMQIKVITESEQDHAKATHTITFWQPSVRKHHITWLTMDHKATMHKTKERIPGMNNRTVNAKPSSQEKNRRSWDVVEALLNVKESAAQGVILTKRCFHSGLHRKGEISTAPASQKPKRREVGKVLKLGKIISSTQTAPQPIPQTEKHHRPVIGHRVVVGFFLKTCNMATGKLRRPSTTTFNMCKQIDCILEDGIRQSTNILASPAIRTSSLESTAGTKDSPDVSNGQQRTRNDPTRHKGPDEMADPIPGRLRHTSHCLPTAFPKSNQVRMDIRNPSVRTGLNQSHARNREAIRLERAPSPIRWTRKVTDLRQHAFSGQIPHANREIHSRSHHHRTRWGIHLHDRVLLNRCDKIQGSRPLRTHSFEKVLGGRFTTSLTQDRALPNIPILQVSKVETKVMKDMFQVHQGRQTHEAQRAGLQAHRTTLPPNTKGRRKPRSTHYGRPTLDLVRGRAQRHQSIATAVNQTLKSTKLLIPANQMPRRKRTTQRLLTWTMRFNMWLTHWPFSTKQMLPSTSTSRRKSTMGSSHKRQKWLLHFGTPIWKILRGVHGPFKRRPNIIHSTSPFVLPDWLPRQGFRKRPVPSLRTTAREAKEPTNSRVIREQMVQDGSRFKVLQKLRRTPNKIPNCHPPTSRLNGFVVQLMRVELNLTPSPGAPIVHFRKLHDITIEVAHDATWSSAIVNNLSRDRLQQSLSNAKGVLETGRLSSPIHSRHNQVSRTNNVRRNQCATTCENTLRPLNGNTATREITQSTNTSPRTSYGINRAWGSPSAKHHPEITTSSTPTLLQGRIHWSHRSGSQMSLS